MSLVEGTGSVQEVNDKLDSLALEIFHLMNEVSESKLQLEQVTREGCLSLAKARYVMGNRNVSTLQLPTEDSANVNALATVVTTNDTNDFNKPSFQLLRVSPEKERQQKSAQHVLTSVLNKRNRKEYEKTDEEKINGECERLLDETSRGIFQDPIKWFGVLVPQNLRNSQKLYQKAVELCVEIANIEAKLDAAYESYDKQLKRKAKLYKKFHKREQ